jgi:predicted RND superfamily exporter protein
LIAAIIARRRWVLAALLVVTAALGLAIPSLEARFAPEELVAPDDGAVAEAARMEALFHADEDPIVVVLELGEGERVTSVETLGWLHDTARALAADPLVARVEGPTTTPLPRLAELEDTTATLDELDDTASSDAMAEAVGAIVAADARRFPAGLLSLAERDVGRVVVAPLVPLDRAPTDADVRALEDVLASDPLVHRRLVSDDRRVAVLAAVPAPSATRDEVERLVRTALARLSRVPPPVGHASLSGLPTLRVTMLDALHADQALLVLLAALGSLVVLALGTRSVAGVVLPMGTVGITIAMTLGAMSLTHVPLDLLTNMIPPLLVTIGLAEAVHMVLRYEDELARLGGDREKAAVATLEAMWLACFVTTFTTAIGFGALMLQETEALRRFGLVAGVASMVAYVVTVLFVPTMLPSMRVRPTPAATPAPDALDRLISILARRAAAHPWATIGVSAALFVGSLAIARGVTVDSTLLDQFDDRSDVARVMHVLERELDGVRRLSIMLEAPAGTFHGAHGLDDLRALEASVADRDGVLRATSAADLALEARALVTGDSTTRQEPLHDDAEVRGLFTLLDAGGSDGDAPLTRFVTADGSAARIEVRLADRGAARILAMLEQVQAEARAAGFTVAFAGEAYDGSRGLDRIVRSLGSFTSAIVAIFVVMMLLFRSVRLGLLSIPPNLLPLAMTLAYMVLRGIALHAATVIVFTVTAGLLVDGATHVIARFREERAHGGTVEEVLFRTMATSGRGVVLSSLTLLLGYGALLFSAFEPVRLFGELSGVAIACALVAQLVLLPAVLAKLAK